MASDKRTGIFQATGGIVNTYKLLLGDKVIKDAINVLGKDKLKAFLKLQHQYDIIVTKNPQLDPLRKLDANDIPVFDGFESYVKWLGGIERTLKVLSNPVQKEMHRIVEALVKAAETAEAEKHARTAKTAESEADATEHTLDGVVVTARVKEANEYHWFQYIGARGFDIVHGNGRTSTTIKKLTVFGLRPSSSGKQYRLVTKETGLTKVFTITSDEYKKLLKSSSPVRQPKVAHSVKAAAASALDSVSAIEIVTAMSANNSIGDEATAKVHFHSNRFVSSLSVPVNIRRTSALPASYPSYDQTMSVVESVASEKRYHERLDATLTETLKSKLEVLVTAMERQRGVRMKSVQELCAEAHEYLIEHGWMQYDLENVAHASYNFAVAGVKHRVTTKGNLVEFEHPRTYAYAFLGVALESAMRKAIVNLIRDTTNGTVLAGYGAGFDVVCACASTWVQRQSRQWLNDTFTRLR